MFCPKCGSEASESQRFCKLCGTNLQMIYDALGTNDSSKGPFGIDVEALTRNAMKFAESWKTGMSNMNINSGPRNIKFHTTEKLEEHIERHKEVRPKDWLRYSWQHNLRDGLLTLFGGAAFGVFLFYFFQTAIGQGTIADVEQVARVHGLERLASLIWLVALIPVAKGLAQILYAAFFAESLGRLTERFRPQPLPQPIQQEPQPRSFSPTTDPIPSVTEHTTQIIKE